MTTNKITSYPFLSKAQIAARLAADDSFVLECLQIMDGRQTNDEREDKTTRWKNRCGWMSSHAVNGTKLALAAREGTLTDEQMGAARAMVSRYTKQLAAHFRGLAIEANPDLAEAARVFSAG